MTNQALALSCELICSVEQAEQVSGSGNHDCCPSTNNQEEQHKSKTSDGCKTHLGDKCFHELFTDGEGTPALIDSKQLDLEYYTSTTMKISLVFKEIRYRGKVPTPHFIEYKNQRKIYLLQDQFLI